MVGVIYSVLGVRSQAPPVVTLIGLLGMLVGEQIIPVAKQMLAGAEFVSACDKTSATTHIFGQLPGRHSVQISELPDDEK